IAALVTRIGAAERAESKRRQQLAFHCLHYRTRAFRREHGVMQAHGEDLVRANRWIRWTSIDHVVEAVTVFVPEKTIKGPYDERCHVGIASATLLITESLRQDLHDLQRVIPERLDFDRFADARCHHPVSDLGVHPGQLYSGGSRV